ncbi:MAG: LamG-like jellyroll fold domain-containing protein, partial [Candidatus Natronoplasma sp.]
SIDDGVRRNPWDQAYWEGGGAITEEDDNSGYADDQWLNYFYGDGNWNEDATFGTGMTRDEVTPNEWYHVVLVRNIEEERIEWWIDGQIDASYDALPYGGETGTPQEDILIGDGYENPYNGRMDDFRIYDRPLSQEEIERLYQNRYQWLGGEAAWWPMNEGEGGIVYDHSPNPKHGDIEGAAWIDRGFTEEGNWASNIWSDSFENKTFVDGFETTADIGVDQNVSVRLGVDESGDESIDVWSDWKELTNGTNDFSRDDFSLPNGYCYRIQYSLQSDDNESTPLVRDYSLVVEEVGPPLLATHYPEDISHESAVLNGELTELNGLPEVDLYFYWREASGQWNEVLVEEDVAEPKTFARELTGLEPYTTHEFYIKGEAEYENKTFEDEGERHIFFTGEELTWSTQEDWESAVEKENIEIDEDSIRLSPTSIEREESEREDWEQYHSRNGVMSEDGDLILQNNPVLKFDGEGDHIQIPADESLDITGDITLSAWVSRESVNGFDLIVGNGGGWNDHGYQLMGWDNGGIRFELQGENDKAAVDSESEALDGWCHVAGVWNDSTNEMRIYVDGELEDTATFDGPIGVSPHDIGIGYGLYETYEGDHWHGLIDDVRVYERALSEEEIQQLSRGGLVDEGLVGWWPMDEGANGTVYDGSSNENHGEIQGSEWIAPNYIDWQNQDGVGTRISPPLSLSEINSVGGSLIEWDSSEPNTTNIDIETAVLEEDRIPTEPLEVFEATSTGHEGTIQNWTVPETGVYELSVRGAQGGGAFGGKGAMVSGEFELEEGEELIIVTGQEGLGPEGTDMEPGHGTGGGASYVAVEEGGEIVPLLVAGGGGANDHEENDAYQHHGRIEGRGGEAYQDGSGSVGTPGENGTGGTGDDGGDWPPVWGGAGWLTGNDGNAAAIRDDPTGCSDTTFVGGFGGGGSSDGSDWSRTAGGGGYSGGAGARGQNWAVGGGGGSFVSDEALSVEKTEGDNTGHGEVAIYKDEWEEAENGETISSIEPGDDLTGKVLWVKQTLSTNSSEETPRLHSLNVEIENELEEGHLLTWPKSMIESRPDLIDLEYELNGQEITLEAIGSPGMEDEESITVEMEGQESENLEWSEGHETYQLRIEMSSQDGSTSPEFYSATLGTEPPSVDTIGAENITYESATLNGEVTDMGTIDSGEVFFRYREKGVEEWNETVKETVEAAQSFSADIEGLSLGTTYEFEAGIGWDDGSEERTGGLMNFTTEEAFELTVNTEGEGTVDREPDQEQYEEGTEVTLTAEADSGWEFVEWTGDADGESEQTSVIMDSDKTVTAIFEEVEGYELKIQIEGQGETEPEEGVHTYSEGEEVTLKASPDSGWAFEGWSGDHEDGSRETVVVIDEDKVVTANFYEPEEWYDLTVNIEGNGSVKVNGEGIEDGATSEFGDGEEVMLTAEPVSSWQFVEWTGDADGESEQTSVIMD